MKIILSVILITLAITANADGKKYYQGQSGNKYQYDMNKPIDQIKYDTDVRAQFRDEMIAIDPIREMKREDDRYNYQFGAGIYDD